jgi:cytochrome c553
VHPDRLVAAEQLIVGARRSSRVTRRVAAGESPRPHGSLPREEDTGLHRTRLVATLALVWASAGCAAAPDPEAIARCPSDPDPGILAALPVGAVAVGDPDRGAALFARECAKCHSRALAGRSSRFFRAYPRLDCLARASDAYLVRAVGDGGPAVGRDDAMKPFREPLGDAGLADVIAHLRSLPALGR